MGLRSLVLAAVTIAEGALPPGPGPFGEVVLEQPVPGAMEFGAPRMCTLQAWLNGTNATSELQAAIDECGDLPEGGVVVVSLGLTLHTASLWLRSNLTLRVEGTLVGTATGRGNKTDPANTNATDAPMVYTRRESTMRWAHAGLLNGGRCVRLKDPLVGWGDCAEWTKLENVVVEGGGILDANAKGWFSDKQDDFDEKTRPIMLDLLWVRGLTIRDLRIIRPGYWTVHPCFCDNVRVENNSIVTSGGNTDGVDPDSTWNVYIAGNILSTGDDCIALKSGRDWSGRMVNISTRNVMIENNTFLKGYSGVAIGSETSAWIEDIVVRNARFDTAEYAIKIKSARGRGGGARNVTLRNLQGDVDDALSFSLQHGSDLNITNASATPEVYDIMLENSALTVINFPPQSGDHYTNYSYLECVGLNESHISQLRFSNVIVNVEGQQTTRIPSTCDFCSGIAEDTFPRPCFDEM